MDYVDAIVLEGLKQASLTSLRNMLNQIVKANMTEVRAIPYDIYKSMVIVDVRPT